MKKAIKDHLKDVLAILGLLVIAGGVSAVILGNQRFRFPIIQEKPLRYYAEIDNAQAVTPGQGQSVQIAGVKIGLIQSVRLRDGRAVIGLDIEREYDDVIRRDASGLLRPRTGLKDMFLELDPGSPDQPLAEEGFTIPSSRTAPDVNVDQFLETLDADTRDHLVLLLGGASRGLEGRGMDLAELFRRFGPTVRDLRRVNEAVAVEREGLKDAIHGLAEVTNELAGKDDELARLVDSSAAVFEAFASEDANVSATVRKLPTALRTTTRTLADVRRFAAELGPTATTLTPVFQELDETNEVMTPIVRELAPLLEDDIRPFVRESRPLVGDLRVAARGVSRSLPDLTTSVSKLNVLFNLLGFNPNGREPADQASRQEGYLFWLAWLTHNTANLINIDDGNGPLRPVFLTGTCQTITNLIQEEPAAEFAFGLSQFLADQCNNPVTPSILPGVVRKQIERDNRATDRALEGTR